MNDMARNLILWIVIALVLMMVFNNFDAPKGTKNDLGYSEFISDVKKGQVKEVLIDKREGTIVGKRSDGSYFRTYNPETNNEALIGDLLKNDVEIKSAPPEKDSILLQILISWFPILLLIGVWIFFMRQMQGGGGGRGAMSFGKSRARLLGEDQVKVTFNDVAGVE